MKDDILVSTAVLIRDAVFSPRRLVVNLKTDRIHREVFLVFFLGSVITVAKSFFVTRKSFTFSFFTNEALNKLIVWLNTPQVSWLIAYASYFLFLLFVFAMCRLFNKQVRFAQVAISLMALSAFGVAMQAAFYVLSFAASKNLLVAGSYLAYVWSFFLSVTIIRATQHLTLPKAALCFFVPAIPFVFVASIVSLAPYLAWLTV